MITLDEATKYLQNCEYRNEINPIFRKELFEAGIVVVYGASDDLIEFDGAWKEELGCYGGGTFYVDKFGLVQNECDNELCPNFSTNRASTIEAIWNKAGVSWSYETKIPHNKFIILKNGELYCIGILFYAKDV